MIWMCALRLTLVCCLVLSCFITPSKAYAGDNALPNTLSVGGGWQELFKNTPYKNGGDLRLEHRWGVSLLSLASDFFQPLDSGFQIHPVIGIETTTRTEVYGFGGLILDFLIGRHIVVSPNFALGYYSQGQGKKLGCPLEFRSTMEAGFRFENEWRLTGYMGHISNAGFGDHNPGVELGGIYIHIPLSP
ncbi:MAG: acyloxyacyl hydrolase [Alphaproteobacteria bacterium]|nr:acyloxyacyl hydrolase [Alphaproteobacteria bacterium]